MKKFILLFLFLFVLKPFLLAQWHPVLDELYQFKGWEEETFLGYGLLNPGDINGDGYDEIISYSSESGKISMFWGGFPPDTLPAFTFFEMGDTWPKYFHEVAVANIDGDSLLELIVPFQHENQVYI